MVLLPKACISKRLRKKAPEELPLRENPGAVGLPATPERRPAKRYPQIAARSSSGVLMGLMPKASTSTLKTPGETNAGSVGPR